MVTILAIDLGKFNSVFCWYDPALKAFSFRTIPTSEANFREALLRQPDVTVVVEACSPAGWVYDLAVLLELKVLVANTNAEAWA
jgi:transposase